MSDSAIKLFGKTIPLLLYHHTDFSSSSSSSTSTSSTATAATTTANQSCFLPVVDDIPDNNSPSSPENKFGKEKEPQELNRESSGKKIRDDKQEDSTTSNQATEDSKDPTTSSGINEKPDRETSTPLKSSSKNGERSETSISQEKTLKKPDKILPCPRCNSMDTKFCYYNNYNVNQPRHFCKNCQRYWTAGGTMRNVPVGAGRRKNKSSSSSSSSHYRHIMVSEALRTAQLHNPSLGNNTTILNFGSDSSLCKSVATVLNISEKTTNNHRSGYHRPQSDNGDDRLSGSSVTTSNSSEKVSNCDLQELATKNYQGFGSHVPCFPGPPWQYPMAAPAFCPSGYPVSFYPAPPFWGCTVPNPWNLQAQCISPTSLLGKHSREGNIINSAANLEDLLSRESNCTETNILLTKTLRIDDPSEAAKSSIWTTLGIENKKSNFNGGGLFKGFQSKPENRNYVADKSSVLQANPAAFSRSLNFHERT